MINCTNCTQPYPETGTPYKCPNCGGTYDFSDFPVYEPDKVELDQPGHWRYRHAFGLPENAPVITLGEGNTPLVWSEAFGQQVAFKLEFLNPTGSHKDRGVSLMTSFLSAHGVTDAVEDSSGNAGSSFAAYAARAGINARIFVPDYASGPKRLQIGGYGQKVVRILGKRSDVTEAVKREAEKGTVYASHAYLPQLLPGFATAAYEIFEQMGRAPEAVVAPVGQGTLLLGIGRGFDNLKRAGLIDDVPRLIGVQAMACAPLWALQSFGMQGMGFVTEGETLAEGVRVRYPLHGDAVLRAVEGSQGFFVAVDEEAILKGRDELGHRGFYVEATSAIIWDALSQISGKISGPIAVILTGHGLKSAT